MCKDYYFRMTQKVGLLTIEYRLKSRIIPTVRSTNEPPKKMLISHPDEDSATCL